MIFFDLHLEFPKQFQVADHVLESFASQHQVQLRFVIHALENCDELIVC
jgi:hypothetical protein